MDLQLYEEAASLFSEALAADPARPDLRVKQAYAFYRLNRLERAEIVLGAELRMRPADPAALILQCFIQYKAGKTAEAEKTALAFQAALDELRKKTKPRDFDDIRRDLFPNAGVPSFILGTIAAKKGDAESARLRFIQARALGGNRRAPS
jgi:tetratricopeptide (TPR) repeat protein